MTRKSVKEWLSDIDRRRKVCVPEIKNKKKITNLKITGVLSVDDG